MPGYSATDLSNLQGYLNAAQSALNAGNTYGAMQNIQNYYDYQVPIRGYASLAAQVATNTGAYGTTANQEISNAIGASQYSQIQTPLSLSLANADFAVIQANPSTVPDESQIETYHSNVFQQYGIPTTAWGGSAYAALGDDWMQGAATPEELAGGHSTNFTSFNTNQISDSLSAVLTAGIEAGATSGVSPLSFAAPSESYLSLSSYFYNYYLPTYGGGETPSQLGTDVSQDSSGNYGVYLSNVDGATAELHYSSSGLLTTVLLYGLDNNSSFYTPAGVSSSIYGSSNDLGVATGGTLFAFGNSNDLTGAAGSTVDIIGSNVTSNVGAGGETNLISGTNINMYMSNGTFGMYSTGTGTVWGSDNTGYVTSGSNINTFGNYNIFSGATSSTIGIFGVGTVTTAASGSTVILAAGSGDTNSQSNGSYQMWSNTSGQLNGNSMTITQASTDQLTVDGTNNKGTGNSTDSVTYIGASDAGDAEAGGVGVYQDLDPDGGGSSPFSSSSSFGLAAKSTKRANVVAQYDLANGHTIAAAHADAAWNRAEQAELASISPTLIQPVSAVNGEKWASKVVTYSFAVGAGSAGAPFSGTIQAQYQTAIEQALQTWSKATGITFEQTTDSSASDIRIGWGAFDTTDSGVLGDTTFTSDGGTFNPGVIVRLEDPTDSAISAGANGAPTYADSGVELYQLALHEIGHALGLADSSDTNSIMAPELGSSNMTLDSSDLANAASLYGSSVKPIVAASSDLVDAGASSLESLSSLAGLSQLNQAISGFNPTTDQVSSIQQFIHTQHTQVMMGSHNQAAQ